ncbi:hypothetical protein GCM10009629_30470 [Pseudonocardia alni]
MTCAAGGSGGGSGETRGKVDPSCNGDGELDRMLDDRHPMIQSAILRGDMPSGNG